MRTIEEQCKLAWEATGFLRTVSTGVKNDALKKMAAALRTNATLIITENKKDLESGKTAGLSDALIDRLRLTEARIESMAQGLEVILNLADPVGEITSGSVRPNGLKIRQVRVPIGVIGIIYEARPNVTSDVVGLCIKSGNAVVLRGSSSAENSNQIIAKLLQEAAQAAGIPANAIQLLDDLTRESVKTLVTCNQYLDLVIPRGSETLIKSVIQNATVPAIETGSGNCHVYIDNEADLDQAIAIAINAKVSRPSVCNSCETILIHSAVANHVAPQLFSALQAKGVEIRGCSRSKAIDPKIISVTDDDFQTEFLDLIVAIRIVDSIDDAIAHIQKYSTRHSEAIVTQNIAKATKFTTEIDAACVLVNASTRFTDGGEFGLGAEMGISTQKLHARGPFGLKELTSLKYIVNGQGQIRE